MMSFIKGSLGGILLSFVLSGVIMSMNVEEISYPNGLRIFVVEDPSSSLVSVRSYVRAGSITEGELLGAGISHYLEHIVAGGTTQKRSEDDYNDLIAKMGGAYNAYTTTDHTSYFINTTPAYLSTAIDVIYEWMSQCKFSESEFDRERDVIIREIERGLANNRRKFYQTAQENFYSFNPLRYPVIGYLENFKTVNRHNLIDYYNEFYVPSNMIVVIGGPVSASTIKGQLDSTFGTMVSKAPPAMISFPEPGPSVTRYREQEADTNVTLLSIRYATTDLGSPDLYPLDLLDVVLTTGEGSLLHKLLVEDEKLAYSVSASSFTPIETSGYFDISLEIDYDKKDQVIDRVLDIMDDLKNKRIEGYRVDRARKQKLSEDIFSVSSIDDKTSRVGSSYLYSGSIHFYDEYVRRFSDVSTDDLHSVLGKYFDRNRAVITLLTPRGVDGDATGSDTVEQTSQGLPVRHTLSNGIPVLLYEDHSLPKTFARVFMGGGIRSENVSQNGRANLAMNMLGKASERYSKDRLQHLIENNGAHMYASMGYNTFYYSLDALSVDFEALFPVYLHSLVTPKFNKDDFEDTKRRQLKRIRTRKDSWSSYAFYEFKKHFYPGHPYGFPFNGEEERVSKMTVSDIDGFLDPYLNPENMVVTVMGDFDSEMVLKVLERDLGKLNTPKDPFTLSTSLERKANTTAADFSFKIPQDLAAVFVAYDALNFSEDEKSFKLDILDAVLSGMNYPGGRLFNLLRGEGLVYQAHATVQTGIENGYFLIYALTTEDQVARVKEIIFEQIDDIKAGNITQEEFDLGIAQMDYYYKDRTSTLESLSLISATDELYGKGFDFYAKVDPFITRLKRQDVAEIAKELLINPQVYEFLPEDKKSEDKK